MGSDPPNDLGALMCCLWMASFVTCVGPCSVQRESLVGSKDTCTIKVKTVFAQKLVNSSREVSVYKIMDFYLGIA